MIPNQWYAILDSGEIKTGKPVGVTRLGEKLVAWRDRQGAVTVMQDLCPHRGAALSLGKLHGDHVACPFHGFEFDPTGRCTLIPANGLNAPVPKAFRVKSYPTREAHGLIFIWWGEPQASYPPVPWFTDLPDDAFSYATTTDHWPVHYTRAIENQLDAIHVPFVHNTTIGRGMGPVVDGPRVEWTADDRFSIYVRNRRDDGTQPPAPPEALEPDPRKFHLEFIFPNLWQNYLGEKVRIFVAFVPVDESNTRLYLRFYQGFATAPVIRAGVNWLATPMNLWVLRQDKRVVLSQLPIRTELRMGEKLVQGDTPIIAFRRKREELQCGPLGLLA